MAGYLKRILTAMTKRAAAPTTDPVNRPLSVSEILDIRYDFADDFRAETPKKAAGARTAA